MPLLNRMAVRAEGSAPAGTRTEMLEIVQTPPLLCGDTNAIGGAIGELRARLAALGGNGAYGFEHSTLRGEQS